MIGKKIRKNYVRFFYEKTAILIIDKTITGAQQIGQHPPRVDALLLGDGPGSQGGKLTNQRRSRPCTKQSRPRKVIIQNKYLINHALILFTFMILSNFFVRDKSSVKMSQYFFSNLEDESNGEEMDSRNQNADEPSG